MNPTPGVENLIMNLVQWLRLGVEITGACTIGIGSAISLFRFAKALMVGKETDFNAIRLTLARYLALALEFQLGADILSTAVAPSWQEIGKLGAIAVIRTGLNFFLSREMQEEKKVSEGESQVETKAANIS
ncbi:DUF1622 domain-containing protein [Mucilaginibacter robiniae]|uniref:DUF1622 domain-containing protein n=1 Tax=Mucilaginibacter robiniae TaxID=2728022 RepID=A0A7L5DWA2_9SPHI|nr:DUF1622 domain-containing protein [Mucilaginibacter robiniae]QJD95031.1 DUF1622 domain-containing protein [Mucilaginibacter robiniae]